MISFSQRILLYFVLLGTALTASAQNGEEPKKTEGIEGKPAPEFVVEKWIQLPEGKKDLKIKDFEGKVLVLLFFQWNNQGAMDVAFPNLKKLSDQYNGNDKVKFAAIQLAFNNLIVNRPNKLQPTAEKFGLKFPFGHYTFTPSFPGMAGTYRTPHTPWFVVVGPDGLVKYNGTQISVEHAIENIDDMLKKK